MFFKIGALKHFSNFTGKHLRWSLFLIKLQLQLYQKETPTQVFSCEVYKFLKNTFFKRTLPIATCASVATTVFENIVVRNRKKYSQNKVSYKFLGSPTQSDHSLFYLVALAMGKFEKTLLTCNI